MNECSATAVGSRIFFFHFRFPTRRVIFAARRYIYIVYLFLSTYIYIDSYTREYMQQQPRQRGVCRTFTEITARLPYTGRGWGGGKRKYAYLYNIIMFVVFHQIPISLVRICRYFHRQNEIVSRPAPVPPSRVIYPPAEI